MAKKIDVIDSLKLFTSKPLKMEFLNLQYNKVNIMVGMNGIGKSFINICVYALATVVNGLIMAKIHKQTINEKELAEFVINACLSPITGTIALRWTSGVSIDVALSEGKVLNITINDIENVEEPCNITYMSSQFRTFNAINGYLAIRKHIEDVPKRIEILVNEYGYRLYDVMYIERLMGVMPYDITQPTRAHLAAHLKDMGINDDITSFDVDLNKCDFHANLANGQKLSLSRWYGSGHQSIINMLLGGALNL